LLRCVVPHTDRAHGVDISPLLLEKAALECPSATLHHYDEWLLSPPIVEFCYSAIVFQHIPESQGLIILEKLLNHTQKACACILSLPTAGIGVCGFCFDFLSRLSLPACRTGCAAGPGASRGFHVLLGP